MRYYQFSLVIILVLLGASSAWALDGTAHAECVGGSHVVTVGGYASGVEDITGLVFKCQAIGDCEPSFFFPETPLPFDPQPDGSGDSYYEAEVTITPPLAGVAYRYSPYGVRSDGSLVHATHHCSADGRTYALASCEEAPIHRATLEFYYADGDVIHFLLAPCDQNCWTEGVMTTLTSTTVEHISDGRSSESFRILGSKSKIFINFPTRRNLPTIVTANMAIISCSYGMLASLIFCHQ